MLWFIIYVYLNLHINYITLHYTTLHYTTLHYITLHYTSCICGRVETWDGCNFLPNTSVFLTPFQSEAWSICSKPIVHQRLLKDGVGKTKHQKLPVLSTGRSCEAVPTSLAQKQTFSQMSSHSTPKWEAAQKHEKLDGCNVSTNTSVFLMPRVWAWPICSEPVCASEALIWDGVDKTTHQEQQVSRKAERLS